MSEVIPYKAETFDIAPDHLMNFIKFRRSIRKFKTEPVTKEQLNTIVESGRFTQTGGNLQDVAYIVIEKDLEELKRLTYESLNEAAKFFIKEVEEGKREGSGYAQLWLKMYDAYTADPENNDRLFFNAPALILVTADSTVNGALASSNMELMTNALGLGTMFSGFFIRALQMSPKLRAFVGVIDASKVATCMVIGHPAVKYERTVPRKEANVTWR
jgi:nitroreductase